MRIPLVDLVAQYQDIKDEMDIAIGEVLRTGHFIGGDQVRNFAAQFAAYCEVPYCVPCANGTDALEMALSSLGIGKGDEVIIPALTFVATMEAVVNVGATPVLCDIDPKRYTMDTNQAISLVTDKTKVFMPVHLYGQMADMDPLASYAQDHHMLLIEDAAQAHGATYKGQKAGSIGDINTFSFYPGKNLGAYGDAGALTTKSEWLYTKAIKMANHGRISKYDHESVGRSSRLDAMQAAVLTVKLKHLEKWTNRRQSLAKRYRELLKEQEYIGLPGEYSNSPSVYHLFVIRVPATKRDDLIQHLRLADIEAGIHYPIALSKLKVTTEQLNIHVHCPEAVKASAEVLSLPIYPELTEDMQDYICEKLINFFQK